MHYRYVKSPPSALPTWKSNILAVFLIFLGITLVAFALVPIFSYQFFFSPRFAQLIKPVPDNNSSGAILGEEANLDMSLASNWFPNAPRLPTRPSKISHYNLSIPKLKISQALVEIGGEDLKKSLIHYPGTALPGQFGNSVIFGHSVLPQFFNPKNYLTIFSTLPTLKKGESILVDFDGVLYKYLVEEMVEVAPDDISVLEQRYDDSYLTLITCVPPGTYLKRLVVKARLAAI